MDVTNDNFDRRTIKPPSLDALRRTKCTIWIDNPDDGLCVYRAAVVVLAHQEWKEAKERRDVCTHVLRLKTFVAMQRKRSQAKGSQTTTRGTDSPPNRAMSHNRHIG